MSSMIIKYLLCLIVKITFIITIKMKSLITKLKFIKKNIIKK